MNFPNKACQTKGLPLLATLLACIAIAGCAISPFGNELTKNTASQSTGAPMPIEATYTQTVPASAAAPAPAVAQPQVAVTAPAGTGATDGASAGSNGTLLSPEEKEKVIAELEALAKKQGAELSAERAKAEAACDNLSADELRKKMLQGDC
jgi:hypothetical protein